MTESSIRGVCPIVDTPFLADGSVDYDSLAHLTSTLVDGGCNAVALFGYASEFYKLTDDERAAMTDVVIDACADTDTAAVISVTEESTGPAVDHAERAVAAGADALMVLPPHTRSPPAAQVRRHLLALDDAVSVPIIVQYAPGPTGASYSPGFFADLYDAAANLTHFKIECEPPGPFVSRLLERTDGDAQVLVGRAGYEMIEAYDRGACGVMPASAMYDIYLEIHDRYHRGDRDGAIELHSELVAVLNQLTKVGIAWDKRILARRGLIETDHCRAPEAVFDDTYDRLFEDYYERYVAPNID